MGSGGVLECMDLANTGRRIPEAVRADDDVNASGGVVLAHAIRWLSGLFVDRLTKRGRGRVFRKDFICPLGNASLLGIGAFGEITPVRTRPIHFPGHANHATITLSRQHIADSGGASIPSG